MLDPLKNMNKTRLVPKRPKGRPRESNIRKTIKSAIIERQLAEKLKDPLELVATQRKLHPKSRRKVAEIEFGGKALETSSVGLIFQSDN